MMRADNLKKCLLYRTNIGVEGCKYLANANWRQLPAIGLCNNIDTEGDYPIGEGEELVIF